MRHTCHVYAGDNVGDDRHAPRSHSPRGQQGVLIRRIHSLPYSRTYSIEWDIQLYMTIVRLPVAILLEGSKVRWIAEHVLFHIVVERDIQLCIMIVLSRALPHRCAFSRRAILAQEKDSTISRRVILAHKRDSTKTWERARPCARVTLLEITQRHHVSDSRAGDSPRYTSSFLRKRYIQIR